MEKADTLAKSRIGLDRRTEGSKLGRNPVESTLSPQEADKMMAALAAAAKQFNMFQKK